MQNYNKQNMVLLNEHYDFMSLFLDKYNPIIPKSSDYYAVIFELRSIRNIKTVIKNHIYFLNNSTSQIKWGLQIFHGLDNEKQLKEELKEIQNINYVNLGISQIKDITQYSAILKTLEFWKKVYGEKVLIFQTDSMLLRYGIDKFIQYDYVGAPWLKPKDNIYVGNGGLSLRNKNKMLEIIKKYPGDIKNPEDIYFSIHMKNANVPDVLLASEFSVEDIFNNDPFGIHKPNKVESNLLKELLLNNRKKLENFEKE